MPEKRDIAAEVLDRLQRAVAKRFPERKPAPQGTVTISGAGRSVTMTEAEFHRLAKEMKRRGRRD